MQLGDARKLDQRTQEALRHRAVLLVEKGATHMEAAQPVGVHRGTVSRWCGAFRRNGASGIGSHLLVHGGTVRCSVALDVRLLWLVLAGGLRRVVANPRPIGELLTATRTSLLSNNSRLND